MSLIHQLAFVNCFFTRSNEPCAERHKQLSGSLLTTSCLCLSAYGECREPKCSAAKLRFGTAAQREATAKMPAAWRRSERPQRKCRRHGGAVRGHSKNNNILSAIEQQRVYAAAPHSPVPHTTLIRSQKSGFWASETIYVDYIPRFSK